MGCQDPDVLVSERRPTLLQPIPEGGRGSPALPISRGPEAPSETSPADSLPRLVELHPQNNPQLTPNPPPQGPTAATEDINGFPQRLLFIQM